MHLSTFVLTLVIPALGAGVHGKRVQGTATTASATAEVLTCPSGNFALQDDYDGLFGVSDSFGHGTVIKFSAQKKASASKFTFVLDNTNRCRLKPVGTTNWAKIAPFTNDDSIEQSAWYIYEMPKGETATADYIEVPLTCGATSDMMLECAPDGHASVDNLVLFTGNQNIMMMTSDDLASAFQATNIHLVKG